MVLTPGGEPVQGPLKRNTFDLDTDFDLETGAIEAATGPKTRIVIVNPPNNPAGRIYPPQRSTGWPAS